MVIRTCADKPPPARQLWAAKDICRPHKKHGAAEGGRNDHGIRTLAAIVGSKRRGEAMIDNRTQVFDVAMKNAHTIEACVDRLAMMGADHELKLVAQRLSRLTFRAASSEDRLRLAK